MISTLFHPAVSTWFERTYGQPTPAQSRAWPVIKQGKHTLIAAPTGSGKTLAAFMSAIDDLVRVGLEQGLQDEVYVLYISPLKALSNDINKNLEVPISGISRILGDKYPVGPFLSGTEESAIQGSALVIRSAVRTGDTTQTERNRMRTKPPHILVTTPESLFILMTSDSGRQMLSTVKTVIIDEIHALAGNKRGSHLSLTLERLETLTTQQPVRIGLSATQKPIEDVAHYLVGNRNEPCEIVDSGYTRQRDLAIVVPDQALGPLMSTEGWQDIYNRLAAIVEANSTTLIFVNTRRLAERAARHLAERLGEENVTAHHGSLAKEHRLSAEQRLKNGELKVLVATASLELGIDIGDVSCVCQLGSPRAISALLQRVGRSGHQVNGIPKGRLFPLTRDDLVECTALLDAVRRGELDRIKIADAHLDVLSQQIIAEVACREWNEDELYNRIVLAWPYRHLEKDKYTECLVMLAEGFTTKRGRRSRYIFRDAVNHQLKPRDGARLTAITNGGAIPDQFEYNVVLEPQGLFIGTLNEDFAFDSSAGDIVQLGNTSYRVLRVEQGKVRVEDAHGQPPTMPFWVSETNGRSDELSASVSRLRANINEKLKDGIDATVAWVLNELNGGSSTEKGSEPFSVSKQDRNIAHDEKGSDPFSGTDPARSATRSVILNERGESKGLFEGASTTLGITKKTERSIEPHVAQQLVEYLAATKNALSTIPTQKDLVIERFFDEAGDQHLVIHSPFGSRVNRAWGLALRKRFCRQFNFELQAAALEDSIVISLGTTHSFPLDEVTRYLHSNTVHDLVIQAVCAAPVFMTRWRWTASIALALRRNNAGKRIPAQFQRMDAEDLISVVFPDQLACQENLAGDREIPAHPLVDQTVHDCLHEVMDIDGLTRLLKQVEEDEVTIHCRDLNGPSPLAQEILFARPYAFLDDAPAEERRTQAVNARRFMDPADAAELAALSPEAIRKVAEEAWPEMATPDELHDALMVLGLVTEEEFALHPSVSSNPGEKGAPSVRSTTGLDADLRQHDVESETPFWRTPEPSGLINTLVEQKRVTILQTKQKKILVCAERLPMVQAVFPNTTMQPDINAAGPAAARDWPTEEALVELVRARLEGSGVTNEPALAAMFECSLGTIRSALMVLENEGYAMRGSFTSSSGTGSNETEWCERGLLARIHRYTIKSLRNSVQAVSSADFMRFLFVWHGMVDRPEGDEAVMAALGRLEGFAIPAAAWEKDILPGRIKAYETASLDHLCLTGRIVWARLNSKPKNKEDSSRTSKAGLLRNTPVTLLDRNTVDYWRPLQQQAEDHIKLSANATAVLNVLKQFGASFFSEIVRYSGLLRTYAEEALAELAAVGLVTSDSYAGLRALIAPASKKPIAGRFQRRRRGVPPVPAIDAAGRWALIAGPAGTDEPETSSSTGWIQTDWETLNQIAYTLLKRYGVVFHKILERESGLPPWRELLYAWRRMEARGEIRGGRFVEGFSGEQFALPDAVALLRKYRHGGQEIPSIVISATDPLNLVGIILPGERIPAIATNRILFQNGLPAAKQLKDEIEYLGAISPPAQWEINFLLTRRNNPAGFIQGTSPLSN